MDSIPIDDLENALNIMRENSMTTEELKEHKMSIEEKIDGSCKKVICKKCKVEFLITYTYNGKFPLCKKHRFKSS